MSAAVNACMQELPALHSAAEAHALLCGAEVPGHAQQGRPRRSDLPSPGAAAAKAFCHIRAAIWNRASQLSSVSSTSSSCLYRASCCNLTALTPRACDRTTRHHTSVTGAPLLCGTRTSHPRLARQPCLCPWATPQCVPCCLHFDALLCAWTAAIIAVGRAVTHHIILSFEQQSGEEGGGGGVPHVLTHAAILNLLPHCHHAMLRQMLHAGRNALRLDDRRAPL